MFVYKMSETYPQFMHLYASLSINYSLTASYSCCFSSVILPPLPPPPLKAPIHITSSQTRRISCDLGVASFGITLSRDVN